METPSESSKHHLFEQLSDLYAEMEAAYNLAADRIGLSCAGCADNCCHTYFQHHTYIEWAYLWEGVHACSPEKRALFIARARAYVSDAGALLTQGIRPRILCPLNEEGLCRLYGHRLMICRLHGVPNSFVRPDGKKMGFPGCARSQDLYATLQEVPVLDRTPHYQRLAALEMAFRALQKTDLPRVDLTLAEMLVQGPPWGFSGPAPP